MYYINEGVAFEDVLLRPRFSSIKSRSEINLCSEFNERHALRLPIISAPMDTVSEAPMAEAMDQSGAMSVIHRYNSIEEQCKHIESLAADCVVAAAIGVSGDYMERATDLYRSGCRFFCVDIAHGHHVLMKLALENLRKTFGSEVSIMAGNIATKQGFTDLANWGADAIRVGIGGGSICSTRVKTGHGIPTLQSILDCSKSEADAKLIADGGLRTSGDIVKALAAGADFVMLGSLLAGTTESPGRLLKDASGGMRKVYRGMASKEAQIDWRGHTASVEGVTSSVPLKGPVDAVLRDLERGIRSGFSYSGARNLRELQAYSAFVKQTAAGATESSTHIVL
jgi:IMP dehydrogenase